MHIREVKIKRKGTEHRYAQFVQSYRRIDGMPAVKVIAGLGELPSQTVANLKLALEASRQGKALILPVEVPEVSAVVLVLANLRYLDIAVVLELWQQWNLSELLGQVIPATDQEGHGPKVPDTDVVAALVIQRCVAPRSKFYAQRWFPTTALPEILGIAPQQFNNTRIHRVLEELNQAGEGLQERLPWLYQHRKGIFAALFMDVTDAYFEGNGCSLAEYGRTKAGLRNKRCVGVVLLCNQDGYPLRWEIVPGKRKDHKIMGDMAEQIKNLPWANKVPLVCDRAMGQAGSVENLSKSGLYFLTAAHVNEIESYTLRIPYRYFAALDLGDTEESYAKDIESAGQIALAQGMEQVDDSLYVFDLGICYKGEKEAQLKSGQSIAAKPLVAKPEDKSASPSDAAAWLALARILRDQIDSGRFENQAAIARKIGLTRTRITHIMSLLKLSPDIQEELLSGKSGDVPTSALRSLCRISQPEKQRELFDQLPRRPNPPRDSMVVPEPESQPPTDMGKSNTQTKPPIKLRLVAYFNPQMFVDQRRLSQEHLKEIDEFIIDLNQRLASPHSHRDKNNIRQEVTLKLKSRNLLDIFKIDTKGNNPIKVKLRMNEYALAKRRRYDGFVLLLAHPDLPQKAKEIALLYRAKDAIEKDFQTIKSVVKLRPIYHHTDPKVRAHVTLCMLSLLLERTLEHRLMATSEKNTAQSALEILATCHLNQLEVHDVMGHAYTVTRLTPLQQNILKALNLEQLADDKEIAKIIIPR